MTCPLCDREPRTTCYHEDDFVWVVDCSSCGTPMIVWKGHIDELTEEEESYVANILEQLFGHAEVYDERRTHPDHWHAHLVTDQGFQQPDTKDGHWLQANPPAEFAKMQKKLMREAERQGWTVTKSKKRGHYKWIPADKSMQIVISSFSPKSSVRALQNLISQLKRSGLVLPNPNEFEDQLAGGLADGMHPEDFEPFDLEWGTRVEREHADDPALAQEIAMDHLVERPDYYERRRDNTGLIEVRGYSRRRKHYEPYGANAAILKTTLAQLLAGDDQGVKDFIEEPEHSDLPPPMTDTVVGMVDDGRNGAGAQLERIYSQDWLRGDPMDLWAEREGLLTRARYSILRALIVGQGDHSIAIRYPHLDPQWHPLETDNAKVSPGGRMVPRVDAFNLREFLRPRGALMYDFREHYGVEGDSDDDAEFLGTNLIWGLEDSDIAPETQSSFILEGYSHLQHKPGPLVQLGFDFMDWSLSEYYWIRMAVLGQMVSAHNSDSDWTAIRDAAEWPPAGVTEKMVPLAFYEYMQFFVGPHGDINRTAKVQPATTPNEYTGLMPLVAYVAEMPVGSGLARGSRLMTAERRTTAALRAATAVGPADNPIPDGQASFLRQKFDYVAAEQPDWVPFREQLLEHGGEEVVAVYDPDLPTFIASGEAWPGAGALLELGELSHCHQNVADLWRAGAIDAIGTGFSLSEDGLWRQHSWGFDGDQVVETTELRELYFGLRLEGPLADEFAADND